MKNIEKMTLKETIDEFFEMINNCEINDSKTLCALLRAYKIN